MPSAAEIISFIMKTPSNAIAQTATKLLKVNHQAQFIDQLNILVVQLIVIPRKLNLKLATRFVEKIPIVMHSSSIPYLKLHNKIARFMWLTVDSMVEEELLMPFASLKKTWIEFLHLSKTMVTNHYPQFKAQLHATKVVQSVIKMAINVSNATLDTSMS